jgi:hypothetical protein
MGMDLDPGFHRGDGKAETTGVGVDVELANSEPLGPELRVN